MIVVNISQCQSGSVSAAYEAGAVLEEAGVIGGADMTPEAALAKLSYVLATVTTHIEKQYCFSIDKLLSNHIKAKEGLATDQRKALLLTNLRGELTQPDMKRLSLSNSNFLASVAASLRVSSETEMKQIRMSLFPSLMCSAAKIGDMETIKMLKNEGGDYTVEDVTGTMIRILFNTFLVRR